MTGRPQVAPTVLYDKQLDKSEFRVYDSFGMDSDSLGVSDSVGGSVSVVGSVASVEVVVSVGAWDSVGRGSVAGSVVGGLVCPSASEVVSPGSVGRVSSWGFGAE